MPTRAALRKSRFELTKCYFLNGCVRCIVADGPVEAIVLSRATNKRVAIFGMIFFDA